MLVHAELTGRVLKIFYGVYNQLGFGFPERICHRRMVLALRDAGLEVESEVTLPVWFRGRTIGRFRADLVLKRSVIVELKTLPLIYPANVVQLLNYLKSTRQEIGLLLNFGRKPQIKRVILTSNYKNPPNGIRGDPRPPAKSVR